MEARGIRFPLESRTFACPPSSGFWDPWTWIPQNSKASSTYVKVHLQSHDVLTGPTCMQEVIGDPSSSLIPLNNPYTPKYNLNVRNLENIFFPAFLALSFVAAQGIPVGFCSVCLAQMTNAGYKSPLLQPLKIPESREDGAYLLSSGSLGLEVKTNKVKEV